jgi:hypothetical protein
LIGEGIMLTLAFIMAVLLVHPASTSPDLKGDVLTEALISEIVSSFMETEGQIFSETCC